MHLAVAQAPVKLGAIEANLKTIEELAGEVRTGGEGLDLLVLPELFTTGYMLRDELFALAEPLPELPHLVGSHDKNESGAFWRGPPVFSHSRPLGSRDFDFGPSTLGLIHLARELNCFLVCGLPESTPQGLYNVAVMVGPQGYLGHYRKMRLPHTGPFEEPTFFGFGAAEQRPLFELPFGMVGVQVCYDIHFPLSSLKLAQEGAQLILNLSAAPSTSQHVFSRLLPARAIETSCFWAYSNNVGPQETLSFWGGSRILNPRGDILAQAPEYERGVAVTELELSDVELAREFRPVLKDGAGDLDGFV